MPTKRAWLFLIIALILYLLANQTQVGWIYVIAAGISGVLGLTFIYSRRRLAPLQADRTFRTVTSKPISATDPLPRNQLAAEPSLSLPTCYEDDPIEVTLRFYNRNIRPAFFINGSETCPFAPPTEQNQTLFIPSLFKNQPVTLSYQTRCDRRGLYTCPPLPLRSSDPIGLFRTKRTLAVPGDLLIYPHFYPLERLSSLERRELGQRETARVGTGTEVIGTREYRPGDSLRQVHWPSTARRGKVVVKEFAAEDHLTLTVVLDLQANSSLGVDKFSTFETAIRLAASLAYYATKKNIPFYLVGAGEKGAPPKTALSWWGSLNYLAKVQNDGTTPLPHFLDRLPPLPFVIVLVSHPTIDTATALLKLSQKSRHTLALMITPDDLIPETAQVAQRPTLIVKNVRSESWQEVVQTL